MFKKVYALRVKPGQKLMSEIVSYCQKKNITSGVIIGIIGSVKNTRLGVTLQDKYGYDWRDYASPMSIVSGQGTIALFGKDLVFHIHMILVGKDGNVGGHLTEAEVWATAEVVIAELDYQLYREMDPELGLSALCAT